jgi:hypothetical protein
MQNQLQTQLKDQTEKMIEAFKVKPSPKWFVVGLKPRNES